jgi:hypothetical protein
MAVKVDREIQPGKPRKNLAFRQVEDFAFRRYSRNARRNSSGSGMGTSSAMAFLLRVATYVSGNAA